MYRILRFIILWIPLHILYFTLYDFMDTPAYTVFYPLIGELLPLNSLKYTRMSKFLLA